MNGETAIPLQGEYEPGANRWARQQVATYEVTNGVEGSDMHGMRVVILTSIGAKSGKLRKAPLMRVEHNGTYAVVASKGGAPDHPDWYYDLKKNPHVELQDGSTRKDYLARELVGDARTLWWERAVAAFPEYSNYETKTTRTIPLFVLTEMAGE